MGFHVPEPAALGPHERRERPYLIRAVVGQILRRDRHPPAPKAEQIRDGDVGADLHAVLEGERDGLAHRAWVAGVEPAGDARGRDVLHYPGVVAELPAAEALPHVDVDVDGLPWVHAVSPTFCVDASSCSR